MGDVLIQTREVAGKWLATVAVLVATDPHEGPEYQQLAASLQRSRTEALKAAVNDWLEGVQ